MDACIVKQGFDLSIHHVPGFLAIIASTVYTNRITIHLMIVLSISEEVVSMKTGLALLGGFPSKDTTKGPLASQDHWAAPFENASTCMLKRDMLAFH